VYDGIDESLPIAASSIQIELTALLSRSVCLPSFGRGFLFLPDGTAAAWWHILYHGREVRRELFSTFRLDFSFGWTTKWLLPFATARRALFRPPSFASPFFGPEEIDGWRFPFFFPLPPADFFSFVFFSKTRSDIYSPSCTPMDKVLLNLNGFFR